MDYDEPPQSDHQKRGKAAKEGSAGSQKGRHASETTENRRLDLSHNSRRSFRNQRRGQNKEKKEEEKESLRKKELEILEAKEREKALKKEEQSQMDREIQQLEKEMKQTSNLKKGVAKRLATLKDAKRNLQKDLQKDINEVHTMEVAMRRAKEVASRQADTREPFDEAFNFEDARVKFMQDGGDPNPYDRRIKCTYPAWEERIGAVAREVASGPYREALDKVRVKISRLAKKESIVLGIIAKGRKSKRRLKWSPTSPNKLGGSGRKRNKKKKDWKKERSQAARDKKEKEREREKEREKEKDKGKREKTSPSTASGAGAGSPPDGNGDKNQKGVATPWT